MAVAGRDCLKSLEMNSPVCEFIVKSLMRNVSLNSLRSLHLYYFRVLTATEDFTVPYENMLFMTNRKQKERGARAMKPIKIVVEKHLEGYVAYPLGLNGVVVGQGGTYEDALTDVQSAIRFHIETFGQEAF